MLGYRRLIAQLELLKAFQVIRSFAFHRSTTTFRHGSSSLDIGDGHQLRQRLYR